MSHRSLADPGVGGALSPFISMQFLGKIGQNNSSASPSFREILDPPRNRMGTITTPLRGSFWQTVGWLYFL